MCSVRFHTLRLSSETNMFQTVKQGKYRPSFRLTWSPANTLLTWTYPEPRIIKHFFYLTDWILTSWSRSYHRTYIYVLASTRVLYPWIKYFDRNLLFRHYGLGVMMFAITNHHLCIGNNCGILDYSKEKN